MKLKDIIILIIVLFVLLIGLLAFTTFINVNNQDDNLNNNSSDNLVNPANDFNNLDNNSNINSNNPDNQENKSNTSSNNNLNKTKNQSDNNLINNLIKTKNQPNNNLNNNLIKSNNNQNQNNVNLSNIMIINLNKTNSTILGSNDKGSVEIIGPIGNKSSNIKIAFIIGVHPLEFNVHNILYNYLIAKSDSLNYCYYIYKIKVTNNPNNYDTGRMNGQILANKFVVPDVISKNYDLVADVHSNQGTNGGNYKKTNFIFAPLNNTTSKALADEIIAKVPPLVYYYPESQTSPDYVTIPIMKSGTPTLVYETYMYESNETTKDLINKLITTIDNLKIK
ncbi:MAG: hypothetical protein LBU74_07445 [Methanobacteriaceae archaeon]|jgi:hypothetical protein|nr:hypothetical protein [Candidatus Methanorudis spinitermitis]